MFGWLRLFVNCPEKVQELHPQDEELSFWCAASDQETDKSTSELRMKLCQHYELKTSRKFNRTLALSLRCSMCDTDEIWKCSRVSLMNHVNGKLEYQRKGQQQKKTVMFSTGIIHVEKFNHVWYTFTYPHETSLIELQPVLVTTCFAAKPGHWKFVHALHTSGNDDQLLQSMLIVIQKKLACRM